ncbi:NTP transferase domain-containing protein [Devosia sp. FKR38]|uniref:molybdenum cofactor guanylyltransferase n=1 Tax=Devosia sp. FKR38 TaxID=2562312 RepID=UPI0010C0D1DB|nr:NTP transferase domain-containing protein [Devosia sp. FKR38]
MTGLPHAVIIAGGAGARLGGVRKGDLRIGNQRLLERVLAALGPVQSPVLVGMGPAPQRLVLPPDCFAVPDLADTPGGPLAGLLAAVKYLAEKGITRGPLVSVAVDTPFLPQDFVALLESGLGAAPAAYAAWGDDFYPPNALWRLEALQSLVSGAQAVAPPASLKALQQALGAVRVDWCPRAKANPFANLNTVKDLIALQNRANG